MLDANEKYIKQISGDEDENTQNNKNDLLLDEAVHILADYISLVDSSKIALSKKK
jgi:hypothetical protein